ncbi:unnamed protein product [Schistosoma bovis]|nr:unnamed protein product [Schistosoma bovis]
MMPRVQNQMKHYWYCLAAKINVSSNKIVVHVLLVEKAMVARIQKNNWSNTMNQIAPDVTQNHRKTEFYIESTYSISNGSVPDIDSQNNAYDFDETSYNNEGNMSAESNDGQKSNFILLDVDFLNDSLSANEIHNEFENNELRSKIVHHHLVIFSGFSSQYEKHGLNKVLLVVICSHKDPTLFRGGGEC